MSEHQVEEFIRAEQKRVEQTYADQYQALLSRIESLERLAEQMMQRLEQHDIAIRAALDK